MKQKTIVLLAIIFAIVGIVLIMLLYVTSYKAKSSTSINRKFEISDEENNIKMLFPDSVIISSSETIISGVHCKLKNYDCIISDNSKIKLIIITMPLETNDTSRKNIFNNYFYNIDSAQNFKAGNLVGLKYQSYICGVPVENFIGISNNKIYLYTETIVGDTLSIKNFHLKSLMIDVIGEDIKTFLTKIKEPRDSLVKHENTKQKKADVINEVSIYSEVLDMNNFRLDISSKIFRSNPDTLLYYIKQQYYAMEHTFQKSIACDFKNGTSKEIISYPNITYSVKLFEKSSDVNPYQTIIKSYTGNKQRK